MGYIPKSAKWNLATIVLEITVEDDPRNIVHRNLTLVRADSPEEAYQKAMHLGAVVNQPYDNPAGKRVTTRFRRLYELIVIHDELEHGSELSYREDISADESVVQQWVSPKEELAVFQPIMRVEKPDYGSADVVKELYERLWHLRPEK